MTRLVENSVVRVLEEKEKTLDNQIEQWEALEEKIRGKEIGGDDMGAAGDDDDELATIRQRRLQQLKSRAAGESKWRENGHGKYEELHSIPEFFAAGKQSSKMVVHFFRPSAWRCEYVDKRLMQLASKHLEIRFVKINAEKAQYLCDKLNVWCIPTLVLIKDGKTEHCIVGLDDLGGENFTPEALEEVLAEKKFIGLD